MSTFDILNQPVQVVETDSGMGDSRSQNYSEPIPEGFYDVELAQFSEWQPRILKHVNVISYDEFGKKKLDEQGNTIRTPMENYSIVQAEVRLKITEGEHAGRFIFAEISTYPNTPWVLPSFLGCFRNDDVSLTPAQFPQLVGNIGRVKVEHNTSVWTALDEAGFEVENKRVRAVVKRYLKKELTSKEVEFPGLPIEELNSDEPTF